MATKKVPLKPLEVNPLLKLVRWTCLISGVIYGFVQRRKYAAIEKVIRDKEEAERPAREAFLAREKQRRNTAELEQLEKIFLGTSSIKDDDETVSDETE